MEKKKTKISGVIRSISDDYEWDADDYFVEFTVIDTLSRLLPVRYAYPSENLAERVLASLKIGQRVGLTLSGTIDDTAEYYHGVGVIRFETDHRPDSTANFFDIGNPPEDERQTRFTGNEERALAATLQRAKNEIREKFKPTVEQMENVESRLDDLAEKVAEISKFDWKKLFVTCVVGVSVDLGFGSTVPEVLVNLFKNLFAGILDHLMLTDSKDLQLERHS